jgi:molybdopterin-synthase adenylyltransferase
MALSEEQIRRYARHVILPEIGGRGQARLLASRVLVIGAGGLGSPLLLYLAAAGVGTLGVVDDDVVDLSNLHRQILHASDRVGMDKTGSAMQGIAALDEAIRVVPHRLRLDAESARSLVRDYDLVADGSDNFATRDAVHAACLAAGRTLASGAVQGFDGQLTTFKAHLGPPHPCLRCLYPVEPPADLMPTCAMNGVLGPAAGVVGCLQAVEVVKELLGIGESLSGTLVLIGLLEAAFDRIRIRRRADCPVCGAEAAAVA